MAFSLLHNHTHFSLLDAITHPAVIMKRCADLGYGSVAMTDHNNLGAAVDFYEAAKDAGIKPILGCEFDLTGAGRLVTLAKNERGWGQVISAVSRWGDRDPHLSLDNFDEQGNIIAITGYPGSDLGNAVFEHPEAAYLCRNKEVILRDFAGSRAGRRDRLVRVAEHYISVFGRENLFFGIEMVDPDLFPARHLVAQAMRWLGQHMKVKCVATTNSHYAKRDDCSDHRVVLCAKLKSTFSDVDRKLRARPDFEMRDFFDSPAFHIPTLDELGQHHTQEEIENTLRVAEMCEEYSILHQPRLPTFPDTPEGMSADKFLEELCERGWRDKIEGRVLDRPIEEYERRLHEVELPVIREAGLADYFLIVQDIMKFGRERGWIMGVGRGCLTYDVPVVVEDGSTKPLGEIAVGDRVIARDGKAHTVLEKFEYDVDEELLCIKTYYGDSGGVTLTKDHEVLTERKCKKPTGDLKWAPASSLKKGDWVFTPTPDSDNPDSITLDLAEFCDLPGTRFDDEFVYHERHNPLTGTLAFSKRLPRYLEVNEWWLTTLGMFVGNGWLKKESYSYFGVAFNGLHKDKIQFIEEGLHRQGIDYTTKYSKDGNLCQIFIRNKVLARMIGKLHSGYRHSSGTKHVPEFVKQLSVHGICAYLRGYFLTDGYFDKNKSIACTTSRVLADQIRNLCRVIGVPSSIRKETRVERRAEWGAGKYTSYYITIPNQELISGRAAERKYRYHHVDGGHITQIRSIETVTGTKKVYDIKVEGEHNYLTSSFLVHNSSAGCLISYLTGITGIDPLPYDLLFERFYNAGRNSPGKISLPDIDMDFPITKRDVVVRYLQEKYGEDHVARIATFQSMQGRSALDAVLSAKGIDFDTRKMITKTLPSPERIAEELQMMDEPSIIRYTLEERASELSEWVHQREDGTLDGDFAPYFAQAIRLEGTKRNISTHPAGVIMANEHLAGIFPLKWDGSTDSYVAAMEYPALEKQGGVKLDVLGVAMLDKLEGVRDQALMGDIFETYV